MGFSGFFFFPFGIISETIVDTDAIDWSAERTFNLLSASVREPELIAHFISRNIIPPTPAAARPWLIDETSGQTVLHHLVLAFGDHYDRNLVDTLCRIGLAVTDVDNDGHDLWDYVLENPPRTAILPRVIHLLQLGADVMANRRTKDTILHALFDMGLGERILKGVESMESVLELFDICKKHGVTLASPNRQRHRPYQLITDGKWRVQVQVLRKLMEHNVVGKDDMMELVNHLRPPELRDCIVGEMCDRGWVEVDDTVPGYGCLSKHKIDNLKLFIRHVYGSK
jgi:hypothetical protein